LTEGRDHAFEILKLGKYERRHYIEIDSSHLFGMTEGAGKTGQLIGVTNETVISIEDNLSFRPKGEISCPESIGTTFTY
jgi:hypothetical protein